MQDSPLASPVLQGAPHLQSVPDARVSAIPLVPPVMFVYLALMIGALPTSALVLFTGAAARRPLIALSGLGFASIALVLPLLPFFGLGLLGSEDPNIALIFLLIRLLSVGLGFAMYKVVNPIYRGHAALGGASLPFMQLIGVAFAWVFLAPGTLKFWVEMPLLALVAGL